MAAVVKIPVDFVLKHRDVMPVIDVRSEHEFAQGHIPGTFNLPLLNNEERRLVGICYKEKGNREAVLLGYELVGHKFRDYIQQAIEIAPERKVMLYCWRGGLRSSIMSELLKSAGFTIYRLHGGYKSFRQWALAQFNASKNVYVLGGHTGSAKTERLQWLKEQGQQVIDLEALANHRGSSFGHIGLGAQPTTEQFENRLALEWSKVNLMKPLWLEDESRMVGRIGIPLNIYTQMRDALLVKVEVPLEQRIKHILSTYGIMPVEELRDATLKLQRRLGDQLCRQAIDYLENNDRESWLKIVLAYYDKTYSHGNSLRPEGKILNMNNDEFVKAITEDDHLPGKLVRSKVYLLLGTNIGDRQDMLRKAEALISDGSGRILKRSSVYETKAWGKTAQDDFLNRVLHIETYYSPTQLLKYILDIERSLGRIRTEKWAPRTIDIDILFYGDKIIKEDHLEVPHPFLHERRFTLVPMAEIAPDYIHPKMKKSITQLLEECDDKLQVLKVC